MFFLFQTLRLYIEGNLSAIAGYGDQNKAAHKKVNSISIITGADF